MWLKVANCGQANACIGRVGISIDYLAAQPRKTTAVGERSRVAASVTHGRTAVYACKPRRGGRDSWHSAAPTGLDVLVSLHRGLRLRLTALRLPTAVVFRADGARQSVVMPTRPLLTLVHAHGDGLLDTTTTTTVTFSNGDHKH